ncbi:phage tail assembly chaperone [Heyndrickxia oleronia]|uniref:phage tail assembly chaperone n=1 Tax=Heyndrickxia oleronia TaxID=38875 RepID=UPI002430D32B|nr:hypothetical protein [Heyndrickxia oleronia]MCI1593214.1 hypothetical protein [Heyndrickxia oleronia]MCI1615455.1 hypothetical protein [Heyndrickxia oleronia]MCI1746195.1 hypothetical protein [Heyndrickxia oleronia]MCI1763578.1 hypothetical protein [Heyndrickxia oleronia]
MSNIKKLTLNDLIKDKERIQPKENVTKELLVERLGATVTIRRAERSLVLDTIDLANDDNFKGNSDEFFVYNIVTEPNLKDTELQKVYGCVEPTDIVHKIFEVGEITSIAQEGMKLAGYNDKVTPVDDLKN